MKNYVENVKNMKEHIGNMKKYAENMKEYEEICRYNGFRTAGTWKNSELCLYIDSGTWKNSEPHLM